jgi:hypothetical protein
VVLKTPVDLRKRLRSRHDSAKVFSRDCETSVAFTRVYTSMPESFRVLFCKEQNHKTFTPPFELSHLFPSFPTIIRNCRFVKTQLFCYFHIPKAVLGQANYFLIV